MRSKEVLKKSMTYEFTTFGGLERPDKVPIDCQAIEDESQVAITQNENAQSSWPPFPHGSNLLTEGDNVVVVVECWHR